jgi:hypothetical protein
MHVSNATNGDGDSNPQVRWLLLLACRVGAICGQFAFWIVQNSCETLALVHFGSAPHVRASTLFKTDIQNLMSIRA